VVEEEQAEASAHEDMRAMRQALLTPIQGKPCMRLEFANVLMNSIGARMLSQATMPLYLHYSFVVV
jgi:hypothetical protein